MHFKFLFALFAATAIAVEVRDLNIGSVFNAATSAAGGLYTSLAGQYTSFVQDAESKLSGLRTYAGYSGLKSGFESAITAGPAAVSSFVNALPTDLDSSARSAFSSAVVKAQSGFAAATSAAGGSVAGTANPTPTGSGADRRAVAAGVVGAVGVLAVAIVL